MTEIVLLDGARTPFGAYGGSLKDLSAEDLGVHAARAALERSGVEPDRIDQVVFGNVVQNGGESIYLARHIGLRAGVPREATALIVNRLCGSGLQAMVSAAQAMLLGESAWALVGGTESMSTVPHIVRGARFGIPLGAGAALEDMLWQALSDSLGNIPMGITAENLAEQYGLDRQACDQFALESQQKAAAATRSGRLAREIAPIEVRDKKGVRVLAADEHIRPETTLEGLGRLPARFKPGGTVTAGNASGVVDGAAALVLATAEAARAAGKRPLARLVSWGIAGVDPATMGIGPAPAARQALQRAGLRLEDMAVVEINEAFASQYLAVEKELGLDRERVNPCGGAIALGHPLGASGARLALTLAYELRERGARYGLAALCIGGGQGIAVVLENLA
jgi:acetyl-CoA acetyltransferase family protein